MLTVTRHIRSVVHARFSSRRDRGSAAVEYGIMAAGILAAITITVPMLGDTLTTSFAPLLDGQVLSGQPSTEERCDALQGEDPQWVLDRSGPGTRCLYAWFNNETGEYELLDTPPVPAGSSN